MGNHLVAGVHVPVECISSDLVPVSTLGVEGRNHFSTFHCRQQWYRSNSSSSAAGVSSSRTGASPPSAEPQESSLEEEFLPFPPYPQWYALERRRLHHLHLTRRILASLENLKSHYCRDKQGNLTSDIQASSNLSAADPEIDYYLRRTRQRISEIRTMMSVKDAGEAAGSHANPFSTCLSKADELTLAQCEDAISFLELSLSSMPRCAPMRTKTDGHDSSQLDSAAVSGHVDVVVKLFSHPETCSPYLLSKLWRMMRLMAHQLEIVDGTYVSKTEHHESEGVQRVIRPSNILFYSLPSEEAGGLQSGVAASPLAPEPSDRGRGYTSFHEDFPSSPKHVYLKRPFIAYSLPERLSSRPYWNCIHRLFAAYQLLKAVQSLHEVYGVTHGDIKPSNVLIQHSEWLLLTDLAPYKPALLPTDRLTLFEYFYDAEENRICYCAPEKFVSYASHHLDDEAAFDNGFAASLSKSGGAGGATSPPYPPQQHRTSPSLVSLPSVSSQSSSLPQSQRASTGYSLSNINVHRHTATMDMFSVGCVLVYIFSEEHPFSLSDILELRSFYNGSMEKKQMEDERVKFVRKMLNDKKQRGMFEAVARRPGTRENEVPKSSQVKVGEDGVEGIPVSESSNAGGTKQEDGLHEDAVDAKVSHKDEAGVELMQLVEEMLILILAASPEERPSSTAVLEAFTPSIFPPFFEYLHEDVFPSILSRDPDRQLLFVSENMHRILDHSALLVSSPIREKEAQEVSVRDAKGQVEGQEEEEGPTRFYVVSLLLPTFLVALRSASQHRCIYEGLKTLEEVMWSYLPIAVKVENVLPHLLYIVQHPEEHDGLTRLTAWRLITATGYAFTAHLLHDHQTYTPRLDRLANTPMQDVLRDAYKPYLPEVIEHDSYVSPFVGMEHGMLFDSLILPLVHSALEGKFSTVLLQEEVVLTEMARTVPALFFLSELCLEWQHNDHFAKDAEACGKSVSTEASNVKFSDTVSQQGLRNRKNGEPSNKINRGEEEETLHTLMAFWQTFHYRKKEVKHLSWTMFQRLITHEVDGVVTQTLVQLPYWIRWFGEEQTQEDVIPFLMQCVPRFVNYKPYSSTRLFFFQQCVLAHGLVEVTGNDLETACGSLFSHSGGTRQLLPYFHNNAYYKTLLSFVSEGLRNKNDHHLLCTVMDSLKDLIKIAKKTMKTINRRKNASCSHGEIVIHECGRHSSNPSLRHNGCFLEEDAQYFLKLVMLTVPFLTHCNRKIGFSAAGVIVQATKVLPVISCLMPLCHAVRRFLVKPVPLLLLQSPNVFPHCMSPGMMEPEWKPSNIFSSGEGIVRGRSFQQKSIEAKFEALFQELRPMFDQQLGLSAIPRRSGIPKAIHMPLLYPLDTPDREHSNLFRLRFPLYSEVIVRKPETSVLPDVVVDGIDEAVTSHEDDEARTSGSVSLADQLLFTLNPSGVAVLSHRTERNAAIYGLAGIGKQRILAVGSKGVAVLMRWNVKGSEECEDEEETTSRTPEYRQRFRKAATASKNTFLASQFIRNAAKNSRFRSEHSLEVLQKFPWCGGAVPGGYEESLSTVEQSFVEMHNTYTALQCMTDRPADQLASVYDHTNCFAALGSSLGYVSVVDVERGIVVYSSTADTDEQCSSGSGCSVTSLLSVQSNVVLSTCSSGLVSLFDIRVPCKSSNMSRVWSSRLRMRDLGMPISSCGLYYAPTDKAYAALIGTSGGACQLVDLRFQLPVQNYWLRRTMMPSDTALSYEPEEITTYMQDAWGSCPSSGAGTASLTYPYESSITQICADPLSSALHELPGSGSTCPSPWLLLSTSCGEVYRLHLASGEIHEALRAPRPRDGAAGWRQTLWVPVTSCLGNSPSSLPRKVSGRMRVFSGGGDGRIRQWDLNDVLCASYTHQKANGRPSVLENYAAHTFAPSHNSSTFQAFPFASPKYYVRLRSRLEPSGSHVDPVLRSTLMEDESSYRIGIQGDHQMAADALSQDGEGELTENGIPPPLHEDAVTALGVAMGNEYMDPGSTLCLLSASRDGMIHVWRNR